MSTIESTPEMAEALYARMERNLAVVRERLGKPLTLADKILLGHLDDPHQQELVPGKSYLHVRPDRVVFQDVLGQSGMLQFMQTGRDRVAVPASIHCDHLIQARVEGEADLAASRDENDEVYRFLRSVAARYGLGFWEPGAGIIHQVVLGITPFPAAMISARTASPNAGGLGMARRRSRRCDAVDVMSGLAFTCGIPSLSRVHLRGSLTGWSSPKDVILEVPASSPSRAEQAPSSSTSGPARDTSVRPGRRRSAIWARKSGATTSCSPSTTRWPPICAPPSVPVWPAWHRKWPPTCGPMTK